MIQASPRDAYRDALTHVDDQGEVRMVDVSEKASTKRVAVAEASILMHPETQEMVLGDRAKKGDVLACARVAGIMASKRTSDLIPMCHPLNITKSKIEIEPIPAEGDGSRHDGRVGFHVLATCGLTGVTGIEMEALMAASIACLTIYDMCKAVDRGMEIVDVRLLSKEGGRSGSWVRVPQELAREGEAAEPAPLGDMSQIFASTDEPALPRHASAVAFIGYQNSGKTTLVEKVIAELTARGMRVGSIKHHGHHGFDIDVPGKDSWRHARAGSRHVGLICENRYAEYADTENELPLDVLLDRFDDVDIVIVEGYKAAGLPNVVVARSGVDRLRGQSSLELVSDATIAIACNDALASHIRLDVDVVDINDARSVADAVWAHWEGVRPRES
ncbi:MAG: cyclic pyranopterin monophosphate synthase MoaC [Collinsella sp.]|nr:cyclic pyranopterin monophosphate synthase MoaC [Collinsella sp.]